MVRIEVRERPLYEVANAYGIGSMELLRVARDELKLSVKSHMSVLSQVDYDKLIRHLDGLRVRKPQAPEAISEKPSPQVRRRKATPVTVAHPVALTPPMARAEEMVSVEVGGSEVETTRVASTPPGSLDVSQAAVVISRPSPKISAKPEETATPPSEEERVALAEVARKGRSDREGGATEEAARKVPPGSLTQKMEVFRPVDYLRREHVFRTKRKRMRTTSGFSKSGPAEATRQKVISYEVPISAVDLAHKLSVKSPDILQKLHELGLQEVNTDTVLDFDTVILVASEFHCTVTDDRFSEDRFSRELDKGVTDSQLQPRAPVVTIMGHVDHGKTTILDMIRKTNVTKGEAGGITQHIGAYQVIHHEKPITFIDTPGHAAFTAMRKRGASVTDIVVLVVAADDGVMPQTREAISHAQAAGVSIIVAINKMDLPGANPERIRNQLSEFGVISEQWGGENIFVEMSAATGKGIDDLLNAILLVAEIADLKAAYALHPVGVVIESRLDRYLGPLATVVVTQGKWKVGGLLIAGTTTGRIRQMLNGRGESLKEAIPGMPIEVVGWDTVVPAGARVDVLSKDNDVEVLRMWRQEQLQKARIEKIAASEPTIEQLMSQVGEVSKELKQNLIIKADVKGSEEALITSIGAMTQESGGSVFHIVYSGCGPLTESDMDLAKTTKSWVVLFHVPFATAMAKQLETNEIPLVHSDVIYHVLEQLEQRLKAGKEPEWIEQNIGEAEVRQVFTVSKVGLVAGSYIKAGKALRSGFARIVRAGEEIGNARISSLKRFKDDVKEVATGYECGISLEGRDDIQTGDILILYQKIQKALG